MTTTEADVKTDTSAYAGLLAAAQAFTPEGGKKFRAQAAIEKETGYLHRLVERVAAIPQEDFDKMPQDAQKWFNASADLINAGQPLVPPPGFVSAFKERGTGAAASAGAPAGAAAAPRAPRKRAELTAGRVIRSALIEDQSLVMSQIKEKLEAAGFKDTKETTIGSYMSDTLETLRVAASLGKFQPTPAPAEAEKAAA